MVKTEAPAYAKAAGNSYSLHLPLARLSSTLHRGEEAPDEPEYTRTAATSQSLPEPFDEQMGITDHSNSLFQTGSITARRLDGTNPVLGDQIQP